jgi:hypothetical protein
MITQEFFNNFIDTYHPNYNKGILRQLSWCHVPVFLNDGYIDFIRRNKRKNLRATFYCKFEDNKIKIKVVYFYFNLINIDLEEYDTVEFYLIGLNNNTYNSLTIKKEPVNFIAEQEILTFIKQFDYYILELEDKPILEEEYDLYMKHLKKKPELIKEHDSDNCKYKLTFYFEHSYIVIRIDYQNKKNIRDCQYYEYTLFRNRLEGYDFNDINNVNNDIHFEVSQRIDEIYYDFQLFFLII